MRNKVIGPVNLKEREALRVKDGQDTIPSCCSSCKGAVLFRVYHLTEVIRLVCERCGRKYSLRTFEGEELDEE